jgi:hypothetical protein
MFFGSKLEAQHGPGHVACDVKWLETGKPAAEYEKFMQDCLAAEAPQRGETAAEVPYGGADTSFIEAVTFFLTGVDATGDEIISERQIALHKYPLVVWLVDDKRCIVRIRNTTGPENWQPAIWQINFCKFTGYQWIDRRWVWLSEPRAWCVANSPSNENYMDPDFTKLGANLGPLGCDFHIWGSQPVGFFGEWDAHMFSTGNETLPYRSQERLMASFKYIRQSLTGKPY